MPGTEIYEHRVLWLPSPGSADDHHSPLVKPEVVTWTDEDRKVRLEPLYALIECSYVDRIILSGNTTEGGVDMIVDDEFMLRWGDRDPYPNVIASNLATEAHDQFYPVFGAAVICEFTKAGEWADLSYPSDYVRRARQLYRRHTVREPGFAREAAIPTGFEALVPTEG